jgi:hypothetical protein
MKFETKSANEIEVTNRDGTKTFVQTKGMRAEDISSLLQDYYRAGFVDGVNVMADAAKNVVAGTAGGAR